MLESVRDLPTSPDASIALHDRGAVRGVRVDFDRALADDLIERALVSPQEVVVDAEPVADASDEVARVGGVERCAVREELLPGRRNRCAPEELVVQRWVDPEHLCRAVIAKADDLTAWRRAAAHRGARETVENVLRDVALEVEQVVVRRRTELNGIVVLRVEHDVRCARRPARAVPKSELRLQHTGAILVAVIDHPLDVGMRKGLHVGLLVGDARRIDPDDERRRSGLRAGAGDADTGDGHSSESDHGACDEPATTPKLHRGR